MMHRLRSAKAESGRCAQTLQVGEAEGQEAIVAKEQQSQVVSKLHGLLRPFLLRRIKSDVEASLPPKKELLLWAPMSSVQRQINDHLRDNTLHVRHPSPCCEMLKERESIGCRMYCS